MNPRTIKILGLTVTLLLLVGPTSASAGQEKQDYLQASEHNLQWFRDAKFGLFVHWGPISLKGEDNVEISFSRKGQRVPGEDPKNVFAPGTIPREEYDSLYKQFNPVKYDPREWVRLAKAAGMQYIVFTTKHHDGFVMFDSKLTDYKITNSPYGRDLVAELAQACHEGGLRLGLYYSTSDWHHPDYGTENHDRYIKYLHGQMRELCSNYGKVDLIWFDGGVPPQGLDLPEMFKLIRQLQPDILLNDRVAGGGLHGDFSTPENYVGAFDLDRMWESCNTLSWPWIWHPNARIMPLKDCIQLLVRCNGRGGNLLLNVGPTPLGEIDAPYASRLREIGHWVDQYGESLFGTQAGPYIMGPNVSTRKGNVVYLHVLDWSSPVVLPPIGRRIARSSVLTGGKVEVGETAEGWRIRVAPADRNEIDTIIKLELDGPVDKIKPILAFDSGSLAAGRKVISSNAHQGLETGAGMAVDDNYDTRWMTDWSKKEDDKVDWLEIDLGKPQTFDRARIMEYSSRVAAFNIQIKQGEEWVTISSGTRIGNTLVLDFKPVTARYVRLNLLGALVDGWSCIREFQLFDSKKMDTQ